MAHILSTAPSIGPLSFEMEPTRNTNISPESDERPKSRDDLNPGSNDSEQADKLFAAEPIPVSRQNRRWGTPLYILGAYVTGEAEHNPSQNPLTVS